MDRACNQKMACAGCELYKLILGENDDLKKSDFSSVLAVVKRPNFGGLCGTSIQGGRAKGPARDTLYIYGLGVSRRRRQRAGLGWPHGACAANGVCRTL